MPASPEIATALLNEFRETEESRNWLRRSVCVMLSKGYTSEEAAVTFEVSVRSAKRWWRAYKKEEGAGLDEKASGAPARLTPQHKDAVRAVLRKRPWQVRIEGDEWTGKRLVEWLQREHSIAISERHGRRLLLLLRPQK